MKRNKLIDLIFDFKKIVLFFLSIFATISVLGQSGKLDIYMKDGSIITGTIKSQDTENAVITLLSGVEIQIPSKQVKKAIPINSIPSDSIYRLSDFSNFEIVSISSSLPVQKSIVSDSSAINKSENDTGFIKLKSGKLINGDVKEDFGFFYSFLLIKGNEKIKISEVDEYQLNNGEYYVRVPYSGNKFAKRKKKGTIEVFETLESYYTPSAPVLVSPGKWSSGGVGTYASRTIKYFRTNNSEPVRKLEYELILPILIQEPDCKDYLENYEYTRKVTKIINYISFGLMGTGLIYFFSADDKNDATVLATLLVGTGGIMQLIPTGENKILEETIDVFNKAEQKNKKK